MNPDYSMGDAIASSVKKMESIASKGYDHLYNYLAYQVADGKMSTSTAESFKAIYGPSNAAEAISSNPAVPGNESIAEKLYIASSGKALIDELAQFKSKLNPEALTNTYTSIADWAKDYVGPESLSAKDISAAILPDPAQGSCLSYAEMKQIIHGLSYGAYPSPKLMEKCSATQYNYLLGKHYEFSSKGKFVAPTEEQLEFHDTVVMTEVQKYKQELNNAKTKLKSTDTSVPEFWSQPLISMPPEMQPVIKAFQELAASDFRIKAVQFTRNPTMWMYSIHILTIKDAHLKQDYSIELIVECAKNSQFVQSIIQDFKHSLETNCVISHDEFAEIAQNKLMDQKKKEQHKYAKKKYDALFANPPQGAKSYIDKGVMHVDPVALQQKSKTQSIEDATLQAITAMFPNAATFECKCPLCGYNAVILNQVIHMNDNHDECTREYIADYLETLDVDLQIKENA